MIQVGGTWLAQWVQHSTLDLEVVNLNSMLSIDNTQKKKIVKKYSSGTIISEKKIFFFFEK